MNLEPRIWGPSYWTTFHYISATYEDKPNRNLQRTMKTFIQSIPVLLPCKECQDHAFDYVKNVDLDKVVDNRTNLFTFFHNFHNSVNQRLGKPQLSLIDAKIKYGLITTQSGYNYLWISLAVVIILILFINLNKN